jgi:hypothetical protein
MRIQPLLYIAIALGVISAMPVFAHCTEPNLNFTIPEGSKATSEQMSTAEQSVNEADSAFEAYADCLQRAQHAEISAGGDSMSLNQKTGVISKCNILRDREANAVRAKAESLEMQYRAFHAKESQAFETVHSTSSHAEKKVPQKPSDSASQDNVTLSLDVEKGKCKEADYSGDISACHSSRFDNARRSYCVAFRYVNRKPRLIRTTLGLQSAAISLIGRGWPAQPKRNQPAPTWPNLCQLTAECFLGNSAS